MIVWITREPTLSILCARSPALHAHILMHEHHSLSSVCPFDHSSQVLPHQFA